MTIIDTVRDELLLNRRTVSELCAYTGLTARQVRSAITRLDLIYHIDRVSGTFYINRRRAYPMKRGIVRHE